MAPARYIGRFAPSPTGALHAGSVATALASWLDARAHGAQARWLVRIEDVDAPRCVAGAAEHILAQLQDLGLLPDAVPPRQSGRGERYAQALAQLRAASHVYGCTCSRKAIELALARQGAAPARHAERVYPGTCRGAGHDGPRAAWRLDVAAVTGGGPQAATVHWFDRRLGPQQQDVAAAVGDFVLQRADGLFSYQLAVVVDDGDQGVTDVVRGEDLTDNTARQVLLQQALGLPRPRYLHTPLVRDAHGEKLSKQTGAVAVDTTAPLAALNAAAAVLGLPPQGGTPAEALAGWVRAWADLYNPGPP